MAPTHVQPPQGRATVVPGGQKDRLGGVQTGLQGNGGQQLLASHIPEPAQAEAAQGGQRPLVRDNLVEEAWYTLEHHYGNKEMIIATLIQDLIATKLTQGAAHKNLKQLCQAVHRATSALKSVDAKASLQNDRGLSLLSSPSYWTCTGSNGTVTTPSGNHGAQ